MAIISSILNLFFKSDLFSKILVIGLFILAITVLFLFLYGIIRFNYKKNEVKYILNKIKNNNNITGNENYFSNILIHSIKKSNDETLFNSLIADFLHTELKIKNLFGISASISPLLGLLGTIWGIMHVFLNLGSSTDLAAIAPGIAEALITTLAGLFVAIPGLVAYHTFNYFIKSYLIITQIAYEEIKLINKL